MHRNIHFKSIFFIMLESADTFLKPDALFIKSAEKISLLML